MRLFQICTLVTNKAEYAAMKASFLAAGFDGVRCKYCEFDNSTDNRWDPYEVITDTLLKAASDPLDERPRWVIFCHQDVVLDQGQGLDDLVKTLGELERQDPEWAVAGNAGTTQRLKHVRHIADRYGVDFSEPVPKRVITLDENLLIVRTGLDLRCSPGMTGFHLYATDLCLNALARGRTVYVVDFRLTHNGMGNVGDSYYEAQHRLQAVWSRWFLCAVIASPISTFGFSRFARIRRFLDSGRAKKFATSHPAFSALILSLNRPFLVGARLKCGNT